MRAAVVASLLVLAGCQVAGPVEPPLVRGPAGRRAVVIVVDATLDPAARGTARLALDAALELAKAEESATGVIAALPGGGRVLVTLGDPAVPGAIETSEGRAPAGRSARKALDALVQADAPNGSLVLLLGPEPAGDDAKDLERVSSDAAQRGFRVFRGPLEAGPRDAIAAVAEEGFSYVAARGKPSSVTPQGGRVAALSFSPALSVKTWNDAPRARIDLPAGTDLLLYRPSWELQLEPDLPPPVLYVGDQVPVALDVTGASVGGLALEVSASSRGKPIALARGNARGGLRFEGEAETPNAPGPNEFGFKLAFAAGEAHFVLDKSYGYLAKSREGTPPPDIRVAPARLDLGVVWADSTVPCQLLVHGDPARAVKVTVESSFAAANALDLAPGEEKPLEVAIEPRRLTGTDRLRLKAEVQGTEGARVRPIVKGGRAVEASGSSAPPRAISVAVACEPKTLRAPASFDLGKVRAGETVERTFSVSGARIEPTVVADEDLAIAATLAGDKLVLRVSPTKEAPPGKRAGRIEMSLVGSRAAAVRRTLTAEVEAPAPALAVKLEPESLALKGRYGWTEARVKVSSNLAAKLEAQPGALAASGGARIAPRRDIRLKPADATWDAASLPAGEARELVLRVYLGSDLPPGKYEGTLALDIRGGEGHVATPLPVSVEVER